MRKVLLLMLFALVITVGGAAVLPATADAAPSYQSLDTSLAETINAYREANGQRPLNISYHLSYVAAHRVQLLMLSNINMGVISIDNRIMPGNYAWREFTSGGNSTEALSRDNPQAVLEHLVEARGLAGSLLDPQFYDIGATLLCNGRRCGYVVILGRPN